MINVIVPQMEYLGAYSLVPVSTGWKHSLYVRRTRAQFPVPLILGR